MVDLPSQIWRDYATDGVPASGAHSPLKSKIREWAAAVDLPRGTSNSLTGALPHNTGWTFTGTWKTGWRFHSSDIATFAGSRSSMAVLREATGSGTNGPTRSDAAMHIESKKTNYLTSSVVGEIDSIYLTMFQGAYSDAGGILIDVSKVSGGDGGVAGLENRTRWVAPTTGALEKHIAVLLGFGESTAGLSSGDGHGVWTESHVSNWFASFISISRKDLTGSPGFKHVLYATDSRSTADAYFGITGPEHANGRGNIFAGTGIGAPFINSSGTSDGYSLWGTGLLLASVNGSHALDLRRRTSDGSLAIFRRDAISVGSISVTTTATSYNISSDGRLKINRKPLDPGDIIDRLEPLRFDWRHAPGQRGVGFIAQDLILLVPEAVTPGDDDLNRRLDDPDFEGWVADYGKLMPYAIAELQSLRRRVASLESR